MEGRRKTGRCGKSEGQQVEKDMDSCVKHLPDSPTKFSFLKLLSCLLLLLLREETMGRWWALSTLQKIDPNWVSSLSASGVLVFLNTV